MQSQSRSSPPSFVPGAAEALRAERRPPKKQVGQDRGVSDWATPKLGGCGSPAPTFGPITHTGKFFKCLFLLMGEQIFFFLESYQLKFQAVGQQLSL